VRNLSIKLYRIYVCNTNITLYHVINNVWYYPRFYVTAVGLGTYYPWIRGSACTGNFEMFLHSDYYSVFCLGTSYYLCWSSDQVSFCKPNFVEFLSLNCVKISIHDSQSLILRQAIISVWDLL